MHAYTDATREHETYTLPDLEIFEDCSLESGGWYWQACFPGCLPDSDPSGPFDTEAAALADARQSAGYCGHGIQEEDICNECEPPEIWILSNALNLHYVCATATYDPEKASGWQSAEAAEQAIEKQGLADAGFKVVKLDADTARKWGR